MIEQTKTVAEAPVELELTDLDQVAGGRKAGEGQKDWVAAPATGGETNIIAVLIGL